MNRRSRMTCTALVAFGASAVVVLAHAQFPASGLRQGAGVDTGAPASSLHGGGAPSAPASAGAMPAWTPRAAAANGASAVLPAHDLQQANLPADLAHLDDNAIIIVGGKQVHAADVKRGVLALDDHAIIIVGGRQTPAATLKRELGTAKPPSVKGMAAATNAGVDTPATRPSTGATTAGVTAAGATSAGATQGAKRPARVSLVANEHLSIVAKKRANLQREYAQLREGQDAVAAGFRPPSQNPTVAASATAATNFPANPAALRTSVGTRPNAVGDPGIVSINGRIQDIRVMPDGKLVIAGNALGDRPGSARLTGGALASNPVPLLVAKWNAGAIEANIPGGTRGVPDEPKAVLEVKTASGATYRFDGITFVAARAEATVKDADRIAQYLHVDAGPTWPQASIAKNAVARWIDGESIDCPRTGTDTLRFRNVNGFEVVGVSMVHARTDSGDRDMAGNAGGRVYSPGYAFGEWRDEVVSRYTGDGSIGAPATFVSALPVSWGIFRSHTSPGFSLDVEFLDPLEFPMITAFGTAVFNLGKIPGTSVPVPTTPPKPVIHESGPRDICLSGYAITSLTVYGPVGVAP